MSADPDVIADLEHVVVGGHRGDVDVGSVAGLRHSMRAIGFSRRWPRRCAADNTAPRMFLRRRAVVAETGRPSRRRFTASSTRSSSSGSISTSGTDHRSNQAGGSSSDE